MDAIADGALGADHRPTYCSAVRTHSRRQAAPGDGISRLPGHHSSCRSVLTGSCGSRGGTGTAYWSVSLSERQVDLEELARRNYYERSAVVATIITARQHPRRRVLRV